MRRNSLLVLACLFAITVVAGSNKSSLQASPQQQPSAQSAAAQQALMNQYCVTCHSQRLKSGNLALDDVDLTKVSEHADVLEKVLRKVKAEMMPPPSVTNRPDKAALNQFSAYIETSLDRLAASQPNPGRTVLHRLNRSEYGNVVRDLLAVDAVDITQILPPDVEAYGFDNIAESLGTSPALMERYLAAAWKVSALAVGNPKITPTKETFRVRPDRTQRDHIEGLPLGTRGGLLVKYNFPVDGEYIIRSQLWSNTVTQVGGLEHPDQAEVLFDGQRVKIASFGGSEDDSKSAAFPTSTKDEIEKRFEITLSVKAGVHEVGVAFIKKTSGPPVDVLRPFMRDRIDPVATAGYVQLERITIEGPFNVSGSGDTPSRRKIFTCRPAAGVDGTPCARTILSTLARRAYRRPATEAEVNRLVGFFQTGQQRVGTFDGGIENALAFLLVSPQFLFRFEYDPERVAQGASYRLGDLELASRLSFFIWSSIPDDQLLDLAVRGRLKDNAVLEQQVKRMLADERARALGGNFAGQWLYLRNVGSQIPNEDIFPDFDDNLRVSMQRETEMLFESIVLEDRSALDLLTADYTFVNERLAKHYGIPGVYGDQMRRVTVRDDYRKGIIGHASILTLTSNADRTNPVNRGKYVLTNILGTPPPPPPPDVPPLNEVSTRVMTMRERMEEHRSNAICSNCHKLMDPVGLALENFDAIGRWRTNDRGVKIETTDTLYNGVEVDGPVALRNVILSKPDQFVRTMTEMLMTYAVGRGIEYYDMPVVRSIVRDAARSNYRFSSVVLGVVKSAPFQMKVKRLQDNEPVADNRAERSASGTSASNQQ